MKRNIIYTSLFLIAFIALIFIGVISFKNVSIGNRKSVETQDYIMSTHVTQKIYGSNAKKAAKSVTARLKEIESKMTIHASGGEVDNLNALAGIKAATLSEETLYVLEKSEEYSKLSEGAFDITIGPMVKAWGINSSNPRIPTEQEIEELKKLVDYRTLLIEKESLQARLQKPGQLIDLGAIAKGYAGDEAIKIYKNYGIESAYINLGGNVIVLGTKPDGSLWRIGIRNPREPSGVYMATIDIADKSIVTSGDYERYFEEGGRIYHHILDPKTGYPAQSGLIGVTIIADLAIDADALSTSCFVMGIEKGMKLIESLSGIEAIFITENKEVYITSGLKDVFSMTDDSKNFRYVEKR